MLGRMSSEGGPSLWELFLRGLAGNAETTARETAIKEGLQKEWYTVPEAAEILKEHPKTVYQRVRAGGIRASRPSPRKTRIHKQDLLAYLRKRAP